MDRNYEENLKVVLGKLEEIDKVKGKFFYECIMEINDSEVAINDERNTEPEERGEFLKDNHFVIGFNELSGESYFVDLREEDSPIYCCGDDGEISLIASSLNKFKNFIMSINELLDSDYDEKMEKDLKILKENIVEDTVTYWDLESWLETNIEYFLENLED